MPDQTNTEPDPVTDLTVLLGYLEMASAGQIELTPQAADMLLQRTRRLSAWFTDGRPETSDYLFDEHGPLAPSPDASSAVPAAVEAAPTASATTAPATTGSAAREPAERPDRSRGRVRAGLSMLRPEHA